MLIYLDIIIFVYSKKTGGGPGASPGGPGGPAPGGGGGGRTGTSPHPDDCKYHIFRGFSVAVFLRICRVYMTRN